MSGFLKWRDGCWVVRRPGLLPPFPTPVQAALAIILMRVRGEQRINMIACVEVPKHLSPEY